MRKFLCALLATMMASGSFAAPQSVELGSDLQFGGGEYSVGGGITVAFEPRKSFDGKLVLCGIWAQSERLAAYVRQSGESVLAKGSFQVNGKTAHRDLRFLKRVEADKSYVGAEANCIKTSIPFAAALEIDARIPRQVIERDPRPGIEISFHASDLQNPALVKGTLLPKSLSELFSD